ncbi:hypothetical protein BaRGS_00024479 [Batillaria attramentaria]|uniref:Glycosyltransferase family 92 protein n=1 Tax=Batillaria attramentaria TaxID=370345 RepID=A0ABD0KAX1_9CAEN
MGIITYHRRPWQLPYQKHVTSLLHLVFSHFLHVIKRCYVSACHHYVISPPFGGRTWQRSVQNVFLFLGTAFLLLLLSSDTTTDISGLDAEIVQRIQALGCKELCWEELKGPLRLVRSLDIEIGLIKNGTLLFRFSPTEQNFPAAKEVTFADVTKRRRAAAEVQGVHPAVGASVGNLGSEFLSRKLKSYVSLEHGAGHSNLGSRFVQFRNPPESGGDKSEVLNVYERRRSLPETKRSKRRVRDINQNNESRTHRKTRSQVGTRYAEHSTTRFTEQNSYNFTDDRKSRFNDFLEPAPVPDDDFLTKPTKTRLASDLYVTSRSWEPITGGDDNLFVYSAFYDDRRGKQPENKNRRVRVLSIGVLHELTEFPNLRRQVFCHFRWKNTTQMHVSQRGLIQSVWDDHNLTYHAMFILCDLHLCASPDYVGITVERGLLPRSYLRIKYPPADRNSHPYNITTCFPVMHSYYDNKPDFLQVMEANQILGSDKFTLYVQNASPDIMAIIKHYVTSGILEAIEWRLPLKNVSHLHYFGQLAAVNDCLYESMYSSRHVVFQDFDEILLPRLHDTWTNMLEEFQFQGTSWWDRWRRLHGGLNYGSFTFLHVFFPKNWTHPGLPGDFIIEGNDSIVNPNSVETFIYGYKEEKPKKGDAQDAIVEGKAVQIEEGKGDTRGKEQQGDTREKIQPEGTEGKAGHLGRPQKPAVPKTLYSRRQTDTAQRNLERDLEHSKTENGQPPRPLLHNDAEKLGKARPSQSERDVGTGADGQRQTDLNSHSAFTEQAIGGLSARSLDASFGAGGQQHIDPTFSTDKAGTNKAVAKQELLNDLSAVQLTWRENIVWATQWRSKMLVQPEAVLMMGIHGVHMLVPGYQNRDLTTDEALVHHYRNWWVKDGTVMVHDTSAHRLEHLLKNSIEKKFELVYNDQLRRGHVIEKTQFDYAWCLIRSRYQEDMKKGVALLEDLLRNEKDDLSKRDYLYYIAVGYTRLKEYERAMKYVDAVTHIEPANHQAKQLHGFIKKKMEKDGMMGIAIVGGAALALGGIVGLGIAALKKK